MSYTCPHCNLFPLEDYIWWASTASKHCRWCCAICGERYPWRAHNRILEVQIGTKEDEAKVFRAHAVLQGLCENLINAHKLLASQQKDGDSPIPNIIMDLKEKCKERITNGLRSFIDLDSHKAVEVGRLRGGQRPFEVV